MSADSLNWRDLDAHDLNFAIVVARFNSAITEKLLAGAREALSKAGAKTQQVFYVPGAYELPFAAKKLATRGDYSAIIALGAVIRGETRHFETVANESASGLMQVQLDSGIPVANGILTTDTEEQAKARAAQKGRDCAEVAVEMANLGKSIAKSHK